MNRYICEACSTRCGDDDRCPDCGEPGVPYVDGVICRDCGAMIDEEDDDNEECPECRVLDEGLDDFYGTDDGL